MKRFLLFGGLIYYPSGGWGDFCGSFDSIEEAEDVFSENSCEWYHIVDSETLGIVRTGSK